MNAKYTNKKKSLGTYRKKKKFQIQKHLQVTGFVNGIIEFDRKLLSPAPSCSSSNRQQPAVRLDSPSMKLWTAMFAAYSALTVAFRVYYIHEFYTVAFVEKSHLLHLLFTSPEPIVFVVMITSCFYLRNLGDRFCALDRLCKQCLPPTADLTAAAAASVERVRLLHAELSELLRTFSAGYGPVLLVYFAFTFVHAVIETFLVVTFKRFRITTNVVPYIFYSQHMVNMLSILCITSWVINKKINIISNLRLVRLTEITDVKTKLQVKYFMNQISVNEPNELTAFGFFNLDLKLIMSILVLLITGIATIIQMKEHSVMIYLNNLLLPQFDRDSS